MVTPDLPLAARTLLKQLQGWSVEGPRHATGPYAFGGLSEETDGEGKRKRIEAVEVVNSVLVRARHADGRALVALYVQSGPRSKVTDGRGWKLDMAWRGRTSGEYTPRQLVTKTGTASATALKAYIAAPDHAAALVAVAENKEEAA